MRIIVRCLAVAAVVGAVSMCSGCSTIGVKPWERDILARPEMALDASPVEGAFDQHMYFIKESASGGRGFGGGGCGCN